MVETRPRWRLGEPATHADPPVDVEVYEVGRGWFPGTLTMRRRDRDGRWWCYVGWRGLIGDAAGWIPYDIGRVRPATSRSASSSPR